MDAAQITNYINQLKVVRCIKHFPDTNRLQIHGFCDASERAYGACIYIRNEISPDKYQSYLLCSKSRVAPIKTLSLPRLELLAALLLARLIDKVKSSLELANVKTLLWSDSTITLNWITSPSRRWSTFVANRVGEIQRLTELSSWLHVASADNPADALSRDLLPNDIVTFDVWWHGPHYLRLPASQWPSTEFNVLVDDLPEQKKAVHTAVASRDVNFIHNLIAKISSLDKILRILAYCCRLAQIKARRPATIAVSPAEILHSLKLLCKIVQKQAFPSEYDSLAKSRSVEASSKLSALAPFMDNEGLIRVGGRLRNSTLSYDARHQMLLPSHHALTKRIIEYEDSRNIHVGVQATMASVR